MSPLDGSGITATNNFRVLGIDLAWGEGSAARPANETGVVAVNSQGDVIDAGWTLGLEETLGWIQQLATDDTLVMIDAPLIVANETGQRSCEKQTGQRYWRWKVAANSSNLRSPRLAGVALRQRLQDQGWRYDDGHDGPPTGGRVMSEVYPYTTIVGAPEFGYDTERPLYKRKPKTMPTAAFRAVRAVACDLLVERLAGLQTGDPAIDLRTHPVTALLLSESSPLADRAYKHREDLIDAAICAWTGLLWLHHGLQRCQALGDPTEAHPRATIIAPARPEQRAVHDHHRQAHPSPSDVTAC